MPSRYHRRSLWQANEGQGRRAEVAFRREHLQTPPQFLKGIMHDRRQESVPAPIERIDWTWAAGGGHRVQGRTVKGLADRFMQGEEAGLSALRLTTMSNCWVRSTSDRSNFSASQYLNPVDDRSPIMVR